MISETGALQLRDNPKFERVNCPICQSTALKQYFAIPYSGLKQKKNLDYSHIGVGLDTLLTVDQCTTCRFVFANPRIKREFEGLVYNESKESQNQALDSELGRVRTKAAFRRLRLAYLPILLGLIDHAPDQPDLNLLDVGAGYGHTLSLVRELGVDGYGVEIDRDRIEWCRTKGLNVLSPQDFDDKNPRLRFDLIVVQSVIEHIVNLSTFLSWIDARAKPGAIVYLNWISPERIKIERRAGRFVKAHFIEHVNYFTRETMDRLMADHGFRPIDTQILRINSKRVRVPDWLMRVAKLVLRTGGTGIEARFYRKNSPEPQALTEEGS